MESSDRQILLLGITKKLVICMIGMLALILLFFFVIFPEIGVDRTYLTVIVFGTGLVGGFVSIQQRIHKITTKELEYLSQSWESVLLIPIYGGIFALAIHVIFLSGIITGHLFPQYSIPTFSDPTTIEEFKQFFTTTLPRSGEDVGKMLFWAFCAGFSERLVPQIIQSVQGAVNDDTKKEAE